MNILLFFFLFFFCCMIPTRWTYDMQFYDMQSYDMDRVVAEKEQQIPEYTEYIEECKYINPLLGKDETFNCCQYQGIFCTPEQHIAEIYLGKRNLGTSIPETIGKLEELTELYINHNQLKGTIPESIGNLKKLTNLHLDNNQLTGEIPETVTNMSRLKDLTLYNNKLEGHIPESIGELTSLNYLYLHRNNLKGSIPFSIGNLKYLFWINVSNNPRLSGPLPSSLADLKYVSVNFKGTSLCYTESTAKFQNKVDYQCSNCTENATPIFEVCECQEGFQGIGYIKCIPDSIVIFKKFDIFLLLILLLINGIIITKILLDKYINRKNKNRYIYI